MVNLTYHIAFADFDVNYVESICSVNHVCNISHLDAASRNMVELQQARIHQTTAIDSMRTPIRAAPKDLEELTCSMFRSTKNFLSIFR